MPEERCRCQHQAKMHEYGVGRCRCGCGWFGSVEEFNRRAAENYRRSIGGPERVTVGPGPGRDCMCPAQNPDCQHPTCPRFPQPGHYHAMVVGVRDLALRARRDGGLIDPHDLLTVVSEERAL